MNTIIEKIRAEIERLKKQLVRGACAAQIQMETSCKDEAYNEVLSVPDTLKEQPVCEGLEEELDRFIASGKSVSVEDCGTYKVSYHDFKRVARHFAQWGAEHAKECEECPSRGNTHSYLKGLEDGKKEMREQMQREAVEGEVILNGHGLLVDVTKWADGYKLNIIVKED